MSTNEHRYSYTYPLLNKSRTPLYRASVSSAAGRWIIKAARHIWSSFGRSPSDRPIVLHFNFFRKIGKGILPLVSSMFFFRRAHARIWIAPPVQALYYRAKIGNWFRTEFRAICRACMAIPKFRAYKIVSRLYLRRTIRQNIIQRMWVALNERIIWRRKAKCERLLRIIIPLSLSQAKEYFSRYIPGRIMQIRYVSTRKNKCPLLMKKKNIGFCKYLFYADASLIIRFDRLVCK